MTLAPQTLAPETTDLKVRLRLADDWFTACDLGALLPGRGVAALLPDGGQVALFRDRGGELYAIDNRDAVTGAAPSSPPRCSSSASTSRPGSAWTTRRCGWRRTR
jgi:nitrite reductase (NADH) small subunit